MGPGSRVLQHETWVLGLGPLSLNLSAFALCRQTKISLGLRSMGFEKHCPRQYPTVCIEVGFRLPVGALDMWVRPSCGDPGSPGEVCKLKLRRLIPSNGAAAAFSHVKGSSSREHCASNDPSKNPHPRYAATGDPSSFVLPRFCQH